MKRKRVDAIKGRKIISLEDQSEKKNLFDRYAGLIIFLFSFFLYANTFQHKFVLDDFGVVAENSMTQQGFKGLPQIFTTGYRSTLTSNDSELYRPFSKAVFAVEWQFWRDSSSAFHVVNVLFYSICCCMLFIVLSLYLKSKTIAFLTSIIFAAHPIHTEVVANIKGADEIFAFLFFLLSLLWIYKYIKENSVVYLVLAVIGYFLSLLSKESAIVFIAVFPLMILFFTDVKIGKNLFVSSLFILPVFAYFILRYQSCGTLTSAAQDNTNYLVNIPGLISQKATAIMLLGNYLKLMFIPTPLMTDGSFSQFPVVTISDWQFIISFVVFIALVIYAIINFKKKTILSFPILFFFITSSIVSNIFILIGTNYGERLMFTPSLAICLAISVIIIKYFSVDENKSAECVSLFFKSKVRPVVAILVILVLFSWKTFSRSSDWKDVMTLYKTDAESAPNSARAHYYLGNQYTIMLPEVVEGVKHSMIAENGISELRRSIEIFPGNSEVYYSLGEIYSNLGLNDSAAENFHKALTLDPANPRFQNNFGDIMYKMGKYPEAMKSFHLAVKQDSLYLLAVTNLGTSYAMVGQQFLEAARHAQLKNDSEALNSNYSASMLNYDTAIYLLNKAIGIDKDFYLPYYLLSNIYQNKNDKEKAKSYYEIANAKK